MLIDGLRRSLGLRRKPWHKVLPWGLLAAAITPAAFFVGFTFLTSGFSVEEAGPFGDPARFFDYVGTLLMLFVALVTPTLLVPDRRHGVLAIYASRPIYPSDYLLARASTVVLLAMLFMLIPQAVLFFGISALNVDGLVAGMKFNAAQIPETLGTIVAYVFGYGAPAFLVSLFVKRVALGTGAYVAGMFMTAALADAIPRTSDLLAFKVLAPLSLFFHPMSVRDWLFDLQGSGMPLARVDLPQWGAAIAIAVLVVVTGVIAQKRYATQI